MLATPRAVLAWRNVQISDRDGRAGEQRPGRPVSTLFHGDDTNAAIEPNRIQTPSRIKPSRISNARSCP